VNATSEAVAEYRQFGQNTASKCRATFLTLLADRTSDPSLVAAAERGRREGLEAIVDSTTGVHIVVAPQRTVIARVRDDAGIHDVTRGHHTGWFCSCSEAGPCAHALAVQQVTEESAQ
jgi:hypothetical protein